MNPLFQLAKQGDEKALEEFFSSHKELVSKICRRFFLLGGEKDDIIQEGMIGLYKALMAYDETKNASFKTFASVVVSRQVMNAVKKYSSNKNNPLNNGLSIDMEGGVKVFQQASHEEMGNEEEPFFYIIPSSEPNPQEKLLSQERLQEMVNDIDSKLSNKEKLVLAQFLQGKSQMQIASGLGLPVKSVDNAITRIKAKLSHFKTNLS